MKLILSIEFVNLNFIYFNRIGMTIDFISVCYHYLKFIMLIQKKSETFNLS